MTIAWAGAVAAHLSSSRSRSDFSTSRSMESSRASTPRDTNRYDYREVGRTGRDLDKTSEQSETSPSLGRYGVDLSTLYGQR